MDNPHLISRFYGVELDPKNLEPNSKMASKSILDPILILGYPSYHLRTKPNSVGREVCIGKNQSPTSTRDKAYKPVL